MKHYLSFLALLLFCQSTNAQTVLGEPYFEDSINIIPDVHEHEITKTWQLLSDQRCDRCYDYVPTDTLLLVFETDHTCYGDWIIRKGTWELKGIELKVNYENSSNEKS